MDTGGSVSEAKRGALERVRWGEGETVSGETLDWDETRGDNATPCFGRIKTGLNAGRACLRHAGAGTDHPGVGRCSQHGGKTDEGRREAAWVIAHRFAQQLQVTPWEGLLLAVRIAAGKVAFIESKLGEAVRDTQYLPLDQQQREDGRRDEATARLTSGDAMRQRPAEAPGRVQIGEDEWLEVVTPENLNWWVKQSEFWHDRLMKVSKLAIDAGVAERLVRQIELEAQLMLRATQLTLDELGLTGEIREKALTAMSRNLLMLEAQETASEEVLGGGI